MSLPYDFRRPADLRGAQVQLDASSIETLTLGFRDLAAGERGWITFKDYGRLFEAGEPSLDRSMWHVLRYISNWSRARYDAFPPQPLSVTSINPRASSSLIARLTALRSIQPYLMNCA